MLYLFENCVTMENIRKQSDNFFARLVKDLQRFFINIFHDFHSGKRDLQKCIKCYLSVKHNFETKKMRKTTKTEDLIIANCNFFSKSESEPIKH